ncbi:MAG: hypothetical protein RL885_31885 [Planctomycetota bacterium]
MSASWMAVGALGMAALAISAFFVLDYLLDGEARFPDSSSAVDRGEDTGLDGILGELPNQPEVEVPPPFQDSDPNVRNIELDRLEALFQKRHYWEGTLEGPFDDFLYPHSDDVALFESDQNYNPYSIELSEDERSQLREILSNANDERRQLISKITWLYIENANEKGLYGGSEAYDPTAPHVNGALVPTRPGQKVYVGTYHGKSGVVRVDQGEFAEITSLQYEAHLRKEERILEILRFFDDAARSR